MYVAPIAPGQAMRASAGGARCATGPLIYRARSRRSNVEQYSFHDGLHRPWMAEPEIAFECQVCHTRMTAPKERGWAEDCLPGLPHSRKRSGKDRAHRRKHAGATEAYTFSEEYDPAAPRPQGRNTSLSIGGGAARSCRLCRIR